MSAKRQLLAQCDLHNHLFNNVVADINDQESNISLCGMNTVKWLAGHLLWDLGSYGTITGNKIIIPWADHFMSVEGASDEDRNTPPGELPALQMIVDKWTEVFPMVRAGLNAVNDGFLSSVFELPHPIHAYDNTIAGLWAFINHHQAYTIGQISALRRGLGKKAMQY